MRRHDHIELPYLGDRGTVHISFPIIWPGAASRQNPGSAAIQDKVHLLLTLGRNALSSAESRVRSHLAGQKARRWSV